LIIIWEIVTRLADNPNGIKKMNKDFILRFSSTFFILSNTF
jgi:hypothetical protein